MRRITFVSLAAGMALAACSGGGADKDGDGKITDQEVAAETAAGLPDPGLYKVTVEIQELAIPGMPAGMGEEMKRSMSANMATETCLTEADREEAIKTWGKPGGEDCTYNKYQMSGGKIDADLSCKTPDGGTMAYIMKGSLGSTGADMTVEGTQQGGDPNNAMRMKMRMKSERIGECAAGEG
jgi:hypothetical protein